MVNTCEKYFLTKSTTATRTKTHLANGKRSRSRQFWSHYNTSVIDQKYLWPERHSVLFAEPEIYTIWRKNHIICEYHLFINDDGSTILLILVVDLHLQLLGIFCHYHYCPFSFLQGALLFVPFDLGLPVARIFLINLLTRSIVGTGNGEPNSRLMTFKRFFSV